MTILNFDFTLSKYEELCKAIQQHYNTCTIYEYLTEYALEHVENTEQQKKKVTIIRHDVDKKPQNSLLMAILEAELGIQSTYYFRTNPNVFDLSIIEKIENIGHEIGYHYEVLDKAKGDPVKAIQLFDQELKMFPHPVRTICMHGNPLTPWDNRDLWKQYNFHDFGITGEAYLSIDYQNILYFSDTGRTWQNTYSVKDFTNSSTVQQSMPHSTMDLTRVCCNTNENICLVTHPQRWNNTLFPWVSELVFQTGKNVGKAMIKNIRGRTIQHENP